MRPSGLSSFVSFFLDTVGKIVDISRVSPPVAPSNCLAGRMQLIISNPGLTPLCHACARCGGAVVVRKREAAFAARSGAAPGAFRSRGLLPDSCSPGLRALFDLWMPSKCLCSQSRSNPTGKKRVATMGMPMGERPWHCPKVKPGSTLEEGRAPSGHPAPRS